MSLLQHEEFAIYQLRTAYLSRIRDGVGERLINVNTAFLNDPAFRAAGWTTNPAELKRAYSPPIPKTATSDYFLAPPAADLGGEFPEDEEGGMVTGRDSNEAVAPTLIAKRRRLKEELDEDDSSDLSDESDEEIENTQRPANQIVFSKMPTRIRSGSSPIRSPSNEPGPDVMVTSPSRPPQFPRLRSGSLGAVEAIKARARRDTVTSSEQSSETELDPSMFRRKKIQPNSSVKASNTITDKLKQAKSTQGADASDILDDDEDGSGSDASSLASGFSDTVDSASLVDIADPLATSTLSNIRPGRPNQVRNVIPKKNKSVELLQELPPPRPISTVQPVSALALAIKAKNSKSPFERYAGLAGSEDPNPLYIKLYIPHCIDLEGAVEMKLKRTASDGLPVTVAQTIGFSLCKYVEEELEPAIPKSRMNVNWWTLRMIEDEEVDYDVPALDRTKPIADFTFNNSRPVRRGRSQAKSWDELALVEATDQQFKENENITPAFTQEAAAVVQDTDNDLPMPVQTKFEPPPRAEAFRNNPITDPRFLNAAHRKDSKHALDAPTPASHATPRTGASKTLNIHYADSDLTPRVTTIEVTTDTYIDEVFDQVCKKLKLDKALYVLKVTGTTTVAPPDRIVEALGANRASLDLTRRRFIGDGGFRAGGSPGSTSPNAPLMIPPTGTPKLRGKDRGQRSFTQQSSSLAQIFGSMNANYKRYNVIRKQPMSFAPSHQRVLVLDGEFVHIMPNDTAKDRPFEAVHGKITSIPFSSVVGCKVNRKHPKTFRMVVFKERETKRYDFEATNATEAAEIVQELNNGMEPFRDLIK